MEISLCMIVKDEEKKLKEFLDHHMPLADELIIVDTGSKDNTMKIAKSFTDKVFYVVWHDDFSAARNESIGHATKDWILWLDPDELIRTEDFKKIRSLIKKDAFAYRFIQETGLNKRGICKLFRNDKRISFTYPIHETIKCSIRKLGKEISSARISIYHHPEMTKKKKELYEQLLNKKKILFPKSKVTLEQAQLQSKNL